MTPKVATCPCYPDRAPARKEPGMQCPRCQHENGPQAKFCEDCADVFIVASPTTRSYTDDPRTEDRLGRGCPSPRAAFRNGGNG
jgi:hypothetical protein